MFFDLTEEHLMIQKAARDFANDVLKPGVIERDEHQKFPAEEIRQLGELGFMGMMVDPKYGGGGMDCVSYVLAMEEISKVDASCSVVMSVNNSLVCWGLETYGSEEQKHTAEALIRELDASGIWPGKIVTELVPASDFWDAEEEHQAYLQKHPGGYTCHYVRPTWQLPELKNA